MGGGATMAAHLLADSVGVPYRYIGFTPQILPSAFHPMLMVPLTRSPHWLNRVLWRVAQGFYNRLMDKPYNTHRTRRGLPREEDLFSAVFPREKTLLACDPELMPAPPDLLDVPQVGAFALTDDRPLSPELEAFLDAGAPPIYVGFGSMPDSDPARTTQRVLEAARKAGVRVLLSEGWSGLGLGGELGDSAFAVGPVSHGRLFPRLAGAVHHGGAGTTAASVRAGIPQLVVPHAVDQFLQPIRVCHMLRGGPGGADGLQGPSNTVHAGLERRGPFQTGANNEDVPGHDGREIRTAEQVMAAHDRGSDEVILSVRTLAKKKRQAKIEMAVILAQDDLAFGP